MARAVKLLPTLTLTSSGVDTSTGSGVANSWLVDDAESISVTLNGVTTAPGIQIQVAYVSATSATFVPLTYMTTASPPAIIYLQSTGLAISFPIWPVPFIQMRFGTSNVTSTGYTFTGAAQYEV